METKVIVMLGSLAKIADGIRVIGPFDNEAEATKWIVASHMIKHCTAHVVPLTEPLPL